MTTQASNISVMPNVYGDIEDHDAPTVQLIQNLLREGQTYFGAFHKQCQEVDDYFYGNIEVPTAEGHAPVIPARARSIVNIATDHVDVENFSISVPVSSPRAKARAERLQKFYHGVWQGIKQPVKRTAVRHTFHYGIGFMKVMFASENWPDPPVLEDYGSDAEYRDAMEDFLEKRNVSFPIEVENVNPKRMIWDDSKVGPKWAIEHYSRNDRMFLARKYPQFSSKILGNSQPAQWVEYWDEKYYAYMVDGAIVESGKHGYGFMPYVPISPANTINWDDDSPARRYQGLLHPIRSMLDFHARAMTAYSSIIMTYAWPSIDFKGPSILVERARSDYEMFGAKNSIPQEVDVTVSPRPVPPAELLQFLNILETQIEEATYPNVIRGVRPRGVSSGFAVSVLAGMGRLVFQGVADGMSRAIEQCNSNFARLVENKIRGRITVHGRSSAESFDQTIQPSDIRGYYENRVVLKAEAPEEREREALLALKLYSSGIISLEEAQKRSGVISPLEMQIDQASERLMQSPAFTEQMQRLAAERVGLLGQMEQLLEGNIPGASQDGMAPGMSAMGNEIASQFLAGQAQLQRPGEASIQRERSGQPAAFPRGLSEMDTIANQISNAAGGAINLPSGGTAG